MAALHTADFPTARDCGSVREDLLDYAGQWVDWYQYAHRALAARRIVYDAQSNPALLALHRNLIVRPRTDAARDITRRAIKRGEVASTVRSSTMVDLLVGAMSTHWEMTPESGRRHLRRTFPGSRSRWWTSFLPASRCSRARRRLCRPRRTVRALRVAPGAGVRRNDNAVRAIANETRT